MKTSIEDRNAMIRFTMAEIKTQEERLDLSNWFGWEGGEWQPPLESELDDPAACLEAAEDCGTTLCFGGWLIHIHAEQTRAIIRRSCGAATIMDVVEELLGISETEAARLTLVQRWPDRFHDLYTADAITDAGRVQALEDRLEHFITTGV